MEVAEEKMSRSVIPVFLSSDNNYSPFVATTILSIMDHTKSAVDFYILDGGIYEENKKQILKLISQFPNIGIKFLKVDTEKKFKDFPTRMHFTIDMYTRFLIPELMPDFDKVIYSDVDVIFNGNVADLYSEKLDGFPIGAVPYMFGYFNPDQKEILSYHERLNLSQKHKYFESGLLLLDCKQWRDSKLTDKLLESVSKSGDGVLLTPDQDALNVFFENNYKPLNNKYIVTPERTSLMLSNRETEESIKNPFIFHFTGPIKPWDKPEIEYAEYFWKYAEKTEFYKLLVTNLMAREQIENSLRIKKRSIWFPSGRLYLKYYWRIKMHLLRIECKREKKAEKNNE